MACWEKLITPYENLIDRSTVTVENGVLHCTGEPVILRAEG